MEEPHHPITIAMDAMPIGISWATLANGKIVFMNQMFTRMFGYTLGDFRDLQDWMQKAFADEEQRESNVRKWASYLDQGPNSELIFDPSEMQLRCKDGTVKTVIASGVIIPNNGWILATFVDITARKRDEIKLRVAEQHARESEAIYRHLLLTAPEMITLVPFDQSSGYVSPGVEKVTGFTPEEYLRLGWLDLIHLEDRRIAEKVVAELKRDNLSHIMRYRVLQKTGGHRWVEATVTGYLNSEDNEVTGFVATVRDISSQKIKEEVLAAEFSRISDQALMDELTGIANRRAFNKIMRSEGLRQSRSAGSLSLMLLDVDLFKFYNDRFGHLAGDACLKTLAEAIKGALRRNSDLLARFGGEEFVVVLPMTDEAGAAKVARDILGAVSAAAIPHPVSPHGVVTVSIGCATWPPHAVLDQNTLTHNADEALYCAKEAGRNCFRVALMGNDPVGSIL